MLVLTLLISFFFFLIIGVPVAFVLGLTPLVALITQGETPLVLVAQRIFTGMDSPVLMAVPFFILAGNIMGAGGMTQRLVKFCNLLVGPLRGCRRLLESAQNPQRGDLVEQQPTTRGVLMSVSNMMCGREVADGTFIFPGSPVGIGPETIAPVIVRVNGDDLRVLLDGVFESPQSHEGVPSQERIS